jgi:A/G-specific adenine glycosylase
MASRHRVKPQTANRGEAIAEALLAWYRRGHRDLPWRRTRDPFRIWVSEIMLQQTRAQAVIPYYERFLARFPDVDTLAAASEEEVLALWSGLGYYSRARNLRRGAIAIRANGGFPRDYGAIRELPGVGDYTASAIASMAFGLPHAVLDGNVLRVVARVENDASEVTASPARDRFRAIAQTWLDTLPNPRHPGEFNQALMELGATVCLAKNPLCLLCPLAAVCRAREHGTATQLPVKRPKGEPVRLSGTLLVVRRRGRVLLRRVEPEARRMAGFWELPMSEHLPRAGAHAAIGKFRHSITNHRYTFTVASVGKTPDPDGPAFRWFKPFEIERIPLSTTARKALKIAGIL